MFEITGDDISALGDADLRNLIGRLCEAEMRRLKLPVSAVTWGGNQTAEDGGLDVRVALPIGTPVSGFIPKPETGFQVKKPDMPRAKILEEMKPKRTGIVRPVLIDLANLSGAYVIVSSGGSTSDSALTDRRKAMAEAVKGTDADGKLVLDFYDRNRIATWVRDHAGLIPWVRSRVGKAVPGWQSYGTWSHTPAGTDTSYLADGEARIRTGDKDEGDGISAVEGINRIRKILASPGGVVRLVGLSGVGKTRLAEALFDHNIGEDALDPALAAYTNIADEPNPPPRGMASDLIAGRTCAVLVVDNCPPELHRRLSEIARTEGSTISVITIEYDIREDQPEGTDVFVLDTSSPDVIEKLVRRRYPDLSQVNARTIAEFSGGNARIALALTSQIGKAETVAGLSEEELFKRLFQQRHDPDPSLLSIAQACSLVYSFDGESFTGEEAELPTLSSLIGRSAEDVYAGVAELKRRDLVQIRGKWRAVLPHAVANRLAKMALQNIPATTVQKVLVENASERILLSFSRRLGYLDDSSEAKAIVQGWLVSGGLLGDIINLNELGQAMLTNIAPVMPELVLSVLETALSGADADILRRSKHFVHLLRSLAYEPTFFERALALLIEFAVLPGESKTDTEAVEVVESLFQIMLSGTRAPIEIRVKVTEVLLLSADKKMRSVGVKALETLMKTDGFSSHYEFNFGARSRDYGYHPRTKKDVRTWFDAVLGLASSFALSKSAVGGDVRAAIAREFRGLWTNANVAESLDDIARKIAAKSFWRDGWIAARQTRTYDGKALSPELLSRLTALEKFLRPKDLLNKVRGLVIGSRAGALDFDDFGDEIVHIESEGERASKYAARAARSAAALRELGHQVAVDGEAFETLLPELIVGNARILEFAEALAEATENPRAVWNSIADRFATTEKAGFQLLSGFLSGLQKRDAILSDVILDEILNDHTLARWFPVLQANLKIDEHAIRRLHRALDLGVAPIETFRGLAYGRACDNVPGDQFRDLALAISKRSGGSVVALDMISMRLHSDHDKKRSPVPEVREAGRILLEGFRFQRDHGGNTQQDYELGLIVRASLAGSEGLLAARTLCRRFVIAATKREVYAPDFNDLMQALLEVHPVAILDELFSGDTKSVKQGVQVLREILRRHKALLDGLSDDILLAWCDNNPDIRYPLAASVFTLFKRPKEGELHEWTPLTGKILERAPNAHFVLDEIIRRLYPSSWSGSLSTKLEGRMKLLISLPGGDAPAFATTIEQAKNELRARIENERRLEMDEDRARNRRFE